MKKFLKLIGEVLRSVAEGEAQYGIRKNKAKADYYKKYK